MRQLIVMLVLSLFASCAAISDAVELVGEVREDYQSAKEGFEEAKEEFSKAKDELSAMQKEAFKKADKDGDGEHDWKEKLLYWALLGGGAVEIGRRKLKSMESNTALAFERVDQERAKRKRDVAELRAKQPA